MLNQCTLSGNAASGAASGILCVEGSVAVTNTIAAGNNGGSGTDIYLDFDTSLNYGGSNLVQSDFNGGTITGPAPLRAAANLAPLGNYGGPTPTVPPSPGSPALGAGTVVVNTFATDQRGYAGQTQMNTDSKSADHGLPRDYGPQTTGRREN
jgi:hypothetical protein